MDTESVDTENVDTENIETENVNTAYGDTAYDDYQTNYEDTTDVSDFHNCYTKIHQVLV